MPKSPSSVVRLTVPVSAQLSERLSVLAYLNDLTRSQYVRRALDAYIADSMVDWARLADMETADWYASALARYQDRAILHPAIAVPDITTADRQTVTEAS